MTHYDRPLLDDHDYQPDADMVCGECGWDRAVHSPSARGETTASAVASENAQDSGVRSAVDLVALRSPLSGGEARALELADRPFFWPEGCYADAMDIGPLAALTRWFVRNTNPFKRGRGNASDGVKPIPTITPPSDHPGAVVREAPSGPEPVCGRCMGMHTSSMCLEEHRARRRAGLLTQIRHREEASVEAQSLASERTTADIPEFAALRSCEAGAKTALIHIGALTADYVRRGEEMPVNLMLAQSELAGVRLALGALLRSDVAENRDHRSIVTVLRDAGEDSDG